MNRPRTRYTENPPDKNRCSVFFIIHFNWWPFGLRPSISAWLFTQGFERLSYFIISDCPLLPDVEISWLASKIYLNVSWLYLRFHSPYPDFFWLQFWLDLQRMFSVHLVFFHEMSYRYHGLKFLRIFRGGST